MLCNGIGGVARTGYGWPGSRGICVRDNCGKDEGSML